MGGDICEDMLLALIKQVSLVLYYEVFMFLGKISKQDFPGGGKWARGAHRDFFTPPPEVHFSPPEWGVKCI